ncbi:MAG TPA: CoB--CoM heterodisulfide reductase iron-sulfur subunit A family protein [Spirochaetales bacterium]|nr:CoB--CoM heterodisulfide reductase iron-sulfur subunit A family protein [Spirochaetales bacterium]
MVKSLLQKQCLSHERQKALESKTVCVVGAGISGLTVANSLANEGIRVFVIDKNPFPGGRSVQYGCKATDSCLQCGVCLVRDAVANFKKSSLIDASFSSTPRALHRRENDGYDIEVETIPNPIDWRSCTECGECREVCPKNAVKSIPGWKYYISEHCDRCGKCLVVCPVGAINLERKRQYETFPALSVVISSGFKPFDPAVNLKWGYGANPRVITGSDLESLFCREKFLPSDPELKDLKKIAFILCVGSRNIVEGERHCSRVCCAYSLRMANRIKEEYPDTEIDIYYMDIQYFGKSFSSFWAELKRKINFIRSHPISISIDEQERPLVRYESMSDLRCREEAYDLVVLANGICPPDNGEELAEIFGLDLEAGGFLSAATNAASNNGSGRDSGIFLTGACRRPMGIAECVESAYGAAAGVLRYLGDKV